MKFSSGCWNWSFLILIINDIGKNVSCFRLRILWGDYEWMYLIEYGVIGVVLKG